MRTSLPEAETRMPVSTGRVSSREAEPETLVAVSTKALSGSEIAEDGSSSGNGGKSSACSVRMWKVAFPESSSTSCSAGRSSSETEGCGSDAHDIEKQASRQDDRAFAGDLGLERDAEADVGVGGAELADGAGGGQLHPGKRLDRGAGRGDTSDGLQLREKRIAVERDLHDEFL